MGVRFGTMVLTLPGRPATPWVLAAGADGAGIRYNGRVCRAPGTDWQLAAAVRHMANPPLSVEELPG
jgi:hypothetical protein